MKFKIFYENAQSINNIKIQLPQLVKLINDIQSRIESEIERIQDHGPDIAKMVNYNPGQPPMARINFLQPLQNQITTLINEIITNFRNIKPKYKTEPAKDIYYTIEKLEDSIELSRELATRNNLYSVNAVCRNIHVHLMNLKSKTIDHAFKRNI